MSLRPGVTGSPWLLPITPALIVYAGVVFTGIYAFAEIAGEIYQGEGFRLDHALLAFAAEQQTEALDIFFRAITRAGSFYVTAPVAIIMVTVLLWPRKRIAAALLGFGFGGAALISLGTKLLLARERPELFPDLVDASLTQAFPSGHSTQISALCLAVYLVVRRLSRHRQRVLATLLMLLTLLVASSRVYLQVHYPTDVLAGLLLATTWVAGIDLVFRLYGLTDRGWRLREHR